MNRFEAVTIFSPSISMVSCVLSTIFSLKSSCLNNLLTSWITSSIRPPSTPITTGITFKSSLLDVVDFLKLNSKSHTNFTWSFPRTYPLRHFCLYHFMSFSTKLNSFAHETTNVINAFLCQVRYSLFTNILHSSKRCSTVSLCWPHNLHLLHWANPLEGFHYLFQHSHH